MNDKAIFSIAVGLCVVSLAAGLLSGFKLWELAPSFVVIVSSLVTLHHKSKNGYLAQLMGGIRFSIDFNDHGLQNSAAVFPGPHSPDRRKASV